MIRSPETGLIKLIFETAEGGYQREHTFICIGWFRSVIFIVSGRPCPLCLPLILLPDTRNRMKVTSDSTHLKAIMLTLALALLMLATRGNHWLSDLNLPSASVAIFFIAGFYLGQFKFFSVLYILTLILDFYGAYKRNDYSGCLTFAYPLLVLSYLTLFCAGRYLKTTAERASIHTLAVRLFKLYLTLTVASAIAFLCSKGSYYLLSGYYPEPNLTQFLERITRYFPSYLANAYLYVTCALVLHLIFLNLVVKPKYKQVK